MRPVVVGDYNKKGYDRTNQLALGGRELRRDLSAIHFALTFIQSHHPSAFPWVDLVGGVVGRRHWFAAAQGMGRKTSLGYAIYALVMGVAGLVMNFFFLLRPLLQAAAQQQGPEAAGAIGGAFGGSVGGCFGMALGAMR